VPWGFRKLLNFLSKRYNNVDIYVTENGCSVPGEKDMPFPQILNDTFRVDFYNGYLQNLLLAHQDGVSVKSYFAWSLIDNYEWEMGYTERFGVTHVDFKTLKRTPKQSAGVVSNFFKSNIQGSFKK
jgi:beta-glucosidase/6-phospho-beta-glucosidase/beta-galactosidase